MKTLPGSFRPSPQIVLAAVAVAAAIALPLFGTPYLIDVGTLVLVYVMLGLGLNVVVGFAGLLDLGYAGRRRISQPSP